MPLSPPPPALMTGILPSDSAAVGVKVCATTRPPSRFSATRLVALGRTVAIVGASGQAEAPVASMLVTVTPACVDCGIQAIDTDTAAATSAADVCRRNVHRCRAQNGRVMDPPPESVRL